MAQPGDRLGVVHAGLILYVPVLERTFGTFGLTLKDWLIIVGGGVYRFTGAGIDEVDRAEVAG